MGGEAGRGGSDDGGKAAFLALLGRVIRRLEEPDGPGKAARALLEMMGERGGTGRRGSPGARPGD